MRAKCPSVCRLQVFVTLIPVIRCLFICLALAPAPVISAAAEPAAAFVGSAACAECHQPEFAAWEGSHHDLAMAEVSEDTVLGDFGGASLAAHGVTSVFFRRGVDWMVRTDGPDGVLRDYRIAYTFGWYPLQQYLIAFPGGRYQSLGLAWDSRPAEQGGQRWFHLYPGEEGMGHAHPLHWTSREQNWNYQCAECHSTGLRKGYDLATDSFETSWEEIDVACEACHGPGSRHLEQAALAADGVATAWDRTKGLVLDLSDRDGGTWAIDPETGTPVRSVPRGDRTKIELCARCHSRRGQIHGEYTFGGPLADTHRLSLLDEGLYHAGGQIQDEVFVYGSFLQSKMYRAGVTCTDCHEAHSLKLKADGDLVCARCHEAGRYGAQTHHRHAPGSAGASCVGCHMPERRYMVVDPRADHSMRVPRPDLSVELGTPNACTQCHADKDDEWAAATVRQWYGDQSDRTHYARAIQAGRTGAPGAGNRLMELAVDADQPAVARATALDLLRAYPKPTHLLALPRLLGDTDPWVRAAAVRYLDVADAQTRYRLGMPLLKDPVRLVRIDAAKVLAPLARHELPGGSGKLLSAGLNAYRAAQMATAERPESHLNLGLLETRTGRLAAAQRAYRNAMRLDPAFSPAYVNLADLYRAIGGDAEGEDLLLAGVEAAPDNAALRHALGLLYVRLGRLDEALPELGRAADLDPDSPRYAYVKALAVREVRGLSAALDVLRSAHDRHPGDTELLGALATFSRDAGDRPMALSYARQLAARDPDDPGAADLLRELADED